jgi:hypothetical protein
MNLHFFAFKCYLLPNFQRAINDLLNDKEEDTTAQHNSHLYDTNCRMCRDQQQLREERARAWVFVLQHCIFFWVYL